MKVFGFRPKYDKVRKVWYGVVGSMVYSEGNGKYLMPFREPVRSFVMHIFIMYLWLFSWRIPKMKIQFTRPLTITSTSAFRTGLSSPRTTCVAGATVVTPPPRPHTGHPVGITYVMIWWINDYDDNLCVYVFVRDIWKVVSSLKRINKKSLIV